MPEILNNSDIAVIVVHEIYGINEHIKGVCERLAKSGYNVICPNLLKTDQPYSYAEGQ